MASEEYLNALDDYYSLKKKYLDSYKKKKENIIAKNLPLEQTKKQIKKIKRYCVNCGKEGGTLFRELGDRLSATCQHLSNPCNLNISLERGSVIDCDNYYEQIKNDLDIDKINIICVKLDLIFGLEKEELIVNLFKDYKNDFNENLKLLELWNNFVTEKNSIEIEKISKNEIHDIPSPCDPNQPNKDKKPKQTRETQLIEKKTFLKLKNTQLENYIKTYKECIFQYKSTQKKSFFNDAIEFYINEIIPLIEDIRSVKYDVQTIDKIEVNSKPPIHKWYINNKKQSIENKELLIKDYKVHSNTR